jgi:hypothetical protein
MINNQNSSDITIDNNHITNSSSRAIATWASGYPMTTLIIDHNIIDKSNTGWSGYGGTNGEAVSLSNVNGFTISNNTITRCGTECVDAKVGCRNGSIHHNSIDVSTWNGDPDYRGGHLGIYIDPGNTTQDGIYIFNNYIFGDHGQGIYICPEGTGTATNIQIYNNIINLSYSSGYGICCLNYTTYISHFDNINIHSNTVYTNTQPVHITGAAALYAANAVQFTNNIFMCTGTTVALYVASLNYADGKIALTNNLFYSSFGTVTNSWNGSATTFGANAYTTNPLFATAGSNFHLGLAPASPAIDHGTTVTITADYEGTARPLGSAYDIGAYESVPNATFPGYYVSKYGSNSWNGKAPTYMSSTTGPFLTISKAVTSAIAGDTVYVLPGIYEEQITMTNKQGSSSAWITITSYNGEVCIDGTTATGSNESGIIQLLNGTQYIRVSGINLRKAGYAGVYINGNTTDVTDIKIDHCDISSCCGAGIYAYSQGYGSGIYARRVEFAYSTVHDVHITFLSQEAISFSGVQAFEIHHNILYHYGKEGIDCKSGVSNGSVHHNSIDLSFPEGNAPTGHTGIYIDGYTRISHDIDVYNNYITGYGSSAIVPNAEHPESGGAIENINIYNNVTNLYAYSTYTAGRALDSTHACRWTNIKIYNNTFYNGTSGNHVVRIFPPYSSVSGLVIANNIFCGWAYSSLFFNAMTTAQAVTCTTLENNTYYRVGATTRITYIGIDYLTGTPFGANYIIADPKFTSTLAADLSITSASPCINTGTTDYYPATDYRDYSRTGIPDMGAFEYGAAPATEVSFGNTSYDGATWTAIGARVKAIHAAPAYDGVLNSISTCLFCAYPAGAPMKGALYQYVDWGTSYAGQLLGTTEEIILPNIATNSAEWVTMHFSTPINITAGTQYYLAVHADGNYTVDVNCLATGGESIYTLRAYVYGLPDPFANELTSNYKYAITGNYTPSGSSDQGRIKKFLVGYGDWTGNRDWVANTFDMLDCSKTRATAHGAYLKGVNPSLKIVSYIYPLQTPDYWPTDWNNVKNKGNYFQFEHLGTAIGDRIFQTGIDGNSYNMNISSSWSGDCYVKFYTSSIGEWERSNPICDGYFYDSAYKWLDRDSADWNPGQSAIHGTCTFSDWNQTCLNNWAADTLTFSQSMQNYLTTACPGRDIIIPNAWKWPSHFAEQAHHWHFYEHFIQRMNGVKGEDYGYLTASCKNCIDWMSSTNALGTTVICGGGGWSASDLTWTKEQFNMCFAGCLMAVQNMDKMYFAFNFYPTSASPGRINYYPEMDYIFGQPIGSYLTTFSGEVFTRTFDHYYVAANFGNTLRSVNLGGTNYSLSSRNGIFIERAGGSSNWSKNLSQSNTLSDACSTNYVSGTTYEPMVQGHYFDLLPVSDAEIIDLHATGEPPIYQAVDDTPTSTHDGVATLSYSIAPQFVGQATFRTDIDQVPAGDFDVYKIVLVGAYANNPALTGTAYTLVREHNVITTSSAIIPTTESTTAFLYYYTTYAARPSDGLPWTKEDVSPIEFGHRLAWDIGHASDSVRCTQQFVRVYFGPPGTIWNDGMPSSVLPPNASPKSLARTPDGRIHAVYKGPSYTQHAISSTNGYSWGSFTNLVSGGYEPSCTPDSSGNIHIILDDTYLKYNKYNVTTNAFDGSIILSTGTCRYPDICVDAADNLHIVHVDTAANAACVYYDKKIAGVWSTQNAGEVAITTITGFSVYAPSILTDSSNNLHVIYYSTDGAVRWQRGVGIPTPVWSATTTISDGTWPGEIPYTLSDNLGNIHVVWKSKNPNPAVMNVRYRKWNVSNNTWNTVETITADATYCQETPSIAVDKRSRLYIVWAGKSTSSPTVQQLRYRTKDIDATTWSAITELTSQVSDQWRPICLRQGYYPQYPTECFGTPRPHESHQGASFIYRDHLSTATGNNDALIYGWTPSVKYSYPNIAYITSSQLSDIATNVGAHSKLSYDQTTSRFYAAYVATTNGQPNIFVSETYNDGNAWIHSQLTNSAVNIQSDPSLAVGTDGKKNVVWTAGNTLIYWSQKVGAMGSWTTPTTIAAGNTPAIATGNDNIVNFMWLNNTGTGNLKFKRYDSAWLAEEDVYDNEIGSSMSTWSATKIELAVEVGTNYPMAAIVFTNAAGNQQKLSIIKRNPSTGWSREYPLGLVIATPPTTAYGQPSLISAGTGLSRCSYLFTSSGTTAINHQYNSDITTWGAGGFTTIAPPLSGVTYFDPVGTLDSTVSASVLWSEYSSVSGMYSLKYKTKGASWPTSTTTAMVQSSPIRYVSAITDLARSNFGFFAMYTDSSTPTSVNLYVTTYSAFAYASRYINENNLLTDTIRIKVSNRRVAENTPITDSIYIDYINTLDASLDFYQVPIEWLSSSSGDYNLQMGTEMAQTFTIGYSGANKIFIPKQVDFRAYRAGTIPGDMQVISSLWTVNASGAPAGTPLAMGAIPASWFSASASHPVSVPFSDNIYRCQPNTMYAVVTSITGGDVDDYILYKGHSASPYGGGGRWLRTGGAWSSTAGNTMFNIRGTVPSVQQQAATIGPFFTTLNALTDYVAQTFIPSAPFRFCKVGFSVKTDDRGLTTLSAFLTTCRPDGSPGTGVLWGTTMNGMFFSTITASWFFFETSESADYKLTVNRPYAVCLKKVGAGGGPILYVRNSVTANSTGNLYLSSDSGSTWTSWTADALHEIWSRDNSALLLQSLNTGDNTKQPSSLTKQETATLTATMTAAKKGNNKILAETLIESGGIITPEPPLIIRKVGYMILIEV